MIKLNQKWNKNDMGFVLVVGGPLHHGRHVWIMKIRPHLEKNTFLINVGFMHFPNFNKVKIPQFLSYEGVLALFGNLKESFNQCLWSHVKMIFDAPCVSFWKKCLFVDFENDL